MSMRNFNSPNVAKNGMTPGKERAMVATGEGNRHVYLGTFFRFYIHINENVIHCHFHFSY